MEHRDDFVHPPVYAPSNPAHPAARAVARSAPPAQAHMIRVAPEEGRPETVFGMWISFLCR